VEAGTGIEPVFTDLQSGHIALNRRGFAPEQTAERRANVRATSEQEKGKKNEQLAAD